MPAAAEEPRRLADQLQAAPGAADDKVRFVGDPVACVVAETVAQAKDAAEAVALDIEPLPAVTSARDALKPGAPLVCDEVPDNVALDFHYGDGAKVAEAFAKATHVTRLATSISAWSSHRWSRARRSANSMRPRTNGRCIRAARACSA